jgi:hypothetical protein
MTTNDSDLTPRETDALNLRAAGATYRQVQKALGFASTSGAYDCVQRALLKLKTEASDLARMLEAVRLDQVIRALWPSIVGTVVDGVHVDPPFNEMATAINRFVQVSKRRADMLGLDAPVRIDFETEVREWAREEGLDEEQAVRDAERHLRRIQNAG